MRSGSAALAALSLLGLLVAPLAPSAPLAAQAPAGADGGGTLAGRVVLGAEAVPSVPVTLHRVTPDSSGAVASAVTGPDGAFVFPLPPAGDAAFTVFFATADYLGVRYFGPPVHPAEAPAGYAVEVHDTTGALPTPPRITRRDVVLIPLSAGGWEIDEVVTVHNPTDLTLVGRGGLPAWELRIPEDALQFEAGEGDVCATDLQRMDDRVLLVSPVVPGSCNLFFRYLYPAQGGGVDLPVSAATDTFNLYVRQPSPEIRVAELGTPTTVAAEGETFLRYEALGVEAGDEFRVGWSVEGAPPVDPVAAAVGVTVLVLLVGAWTASRMRASGAAPK